MKLYEWEAIGYFDNSLQHGYMKAKSPGDFYRLMNLFYDHHSVRIIRVYL